ncbi:MAG: MarR family transcriptional regulator [Anaerovibrio sp.]|nr:MarR family transcriptional regulator [Selenomonadaceae bacterium]MDY6054152.1 MarR family transcriptional regulator [Anaerovibrio sp.]
MELYDFANYFSVIRRRSQALLVEACSEYKLNYSEFALLLKLYDMEGCSQDAMVEVLSIDKAAVTRILKSLEEMDLVYRRIDTEDRRIKRIFLTDSGKSMEEKIRNILTKMVTFVVEDIPKDKVVEVMGMIHDASQKLVNAEYEDIYGPRR